MKIVWKINKCLTLSVPPQSPVTDSEHSVKTASVIGGSNGLSRLKRKDRQIRLGIQRVKKFF